MFSKHHSSSQNQLLQQKSIDQDQPTKAQSPFQTSILLNNSFTDAAIIPKEIESDMQSVKSLFNHFDLQSTNNQSDNQKSKTGADIKKNEKKVEKSKF